MSKFQINDIKLDDSDLQDSEVDEIVGGLMSEPMDKSLLRVDLDDEAYMTTVYIPKEPICWFPIKPVKPICPTKPILIFNPCPVIL